MKKLLVLLVLVVALSLPVFAYGYGAGVEVGYPGASVMFTFDPSEQMTVYGGLGYDYSTVGTGATALFAKTGVDFKVAKLIETDTDDGLFLSVGGQLIPHFVFASFGGLAVGGFVLDVLGTAGVSYDFAPFTAYLRIAAGVELGFVTALGYGGIAAGFGWNAALGFVYHF